MARVKLTAGRITQFTTDKEQSFLWDTEAPGLAVRATKAGAKVFVFQAKLNRKTIRIKIGSIKSWTIKKARDSAHRQQSLINQGRDPRQVRQEHIAVDEANRLEKFKQNVTVRSAWESYINERTSKWSALHLRDHQKLAQAGGTKKKRGSGTTNAGILAAFMPMKLAALTPEIVSQWLAKESTTRPTQVALAYRLLRAFLRWCAATPEFSSAADIEAVGTKVAHYHLPSPRTKGGDCLQREQLSPWFTAVRTLENPVISAYLQALLLTGARREELATLRWKDIDFRWDSLTIGDKNEGSRAIPLTPYVASILTALPRRNQWVFSSLRAESGRLRDARTAHIRALASSGLPHVSLHGLRRSFGTLSEWVEAPVGVVAQIMGHKPSAIAEKYYRRRPLDLLRLWHKKIEGWVLDEAAIEQPSPQVTGLHSIAGN